MSSWIAAATSYSTSNVPMIPFYIYYSMFGLQRVGDLALGRRRHAGAYDSSAARPAVPLLTAKAYSMRTAIVICSRRQFRIACLTTQRSLTKLR